MCTPPRRRSQCCIKTPSPLLSVTHCATCSLHLNLSGSHQCSVLSLVLAWTLCPFRRYLSLCRFEQPCSQEGVRNSAQPSVQSYAAVLLVIRRFSSYFVAYDVAECRIAPASESASLVPKRVDRHSNDGALRVRTDPSTQTLVDMPSRLACSGGTPFMPSTLCSLDSLLPHCCRPCLLLSSLRWLRDQPSLTYLHDD